MPAASLAWVRTVCGVPCNCSALLTVRSESVGTPSSRLAAFRSESVASRMVPDSVCLTSAYLQGSKAGARAKQMSSAGLPQTMLTGLRIQVEHTASSALTFWGQSGVCARLRQLLRPRRRWRPALRGWRAGPLNPLLTWACTDRQ